MTGNKQETDNLKKEYDNIRREYDMIRMKLEESEREK